MAKRYLEINNCGGCAFIAWTSVGPWCLKLKSIVNSIDIPGNCPLPQTDTMCPSMLQLDPLWMAINHDGSVRLFCSEPEWDEDAGEFLGEDEVMLLGNFSVPGLSQGEKKQVVVSV